MRGGARRGTLLRALSLVALCAGLTAAPAAHASFDCGTALVQCQVQLDNSGRAWFGSPEKLTEDALGDGSLSRGIFQVYRRAGNETVLVSRGPDGQPIQPQNAQRVAAWLLGVSPDGERVYLQTDASLVPEDGDAGHEGGSSDGYLLTDDGYTLFTTGPLDGPSPNPNPYIGSHGVWASDDGLYVYFETGQRLVPEDWDNASDLYQRVGGQTRLVSTGPDQALPTPEFPDPFVPETRFLGASPDGATAYFATAEHLTAEDTGKLTSDIFSWRDGVTRRITRTVSPEEVPGTPWEGFDPFSFAGAGGEGTIYFAANSGQVPEDTNGTRDVYRARPDGSLEPLAPSPVGPGGGGYFWVEAVSRDGSRVFLRSTGRLVPEDRDDEGDIYMWSAGGYELVTPRAETDGDKEEELMLCSISGSGERAYFQTWGRLSPQDTDDQPDVYEWRDGPIRLVSPASDGRQSAAFCSGISPNGRFVAFSTWEELVPGDNDVKEDIYVVDMGPAAGEVTASRIKPAKQRQRRRPRLVTAEAIAPRMGIARVGVLLGETARLRLRCPKAERSGPCHGRVRLLRRKGGRVLAAGSFRIRAGRGASVTLKGLRLPRRASRAFVRVRGADLLGNRRTVSAPVALRKPR